MSLLSAKRVQTISVLDLRPGHFQTGSRYSRCVLSVEVIILRRALNFNKSLRVCAREDHAEMPRAYSHTPAGRMLGERF
jgi:hypothetical protein